MLSHALIKPRLVIPVLLGALDERLRKESQFSLGLQESAGNVAFFVGVPEFWEHIEFVHGNHCVYFS